MQSEGLAMGFAGRAFVIGLFVVSCGSLVYEVAEAYKQSSLRKSGVHVGKKELITFAQGIAAIAIWSTFAVIYNLFGFGPLLILLLALALVVFVLGFVSTTFVEKFMSAFALMEDKAEWIVYWMFLLMGGAWFYFLLFAPFGVLCALDLRPCGGLKQ